MKKSIKTRLILMRLLGYKCFSRGEGMEALMTTKNLNQYNQKSAIVLPLKNASKGSVVEAMNVVFKEYSDYFKVDKITSEYITYRLDREETSIIYCEFYEILQSML